MWRCENGCGRVVQTFVNDDVRAHGRICNRRPRPVAPRETEVRPAARPPPRVRFLQPDRRQTAASLPPRAPPHQPAPSHTPVPLPPLAHPGPVHPQAAARPPHRPREAALPHPARPQQPRARPLDEDGANVHPRPITIPQRSWDLLMSKDPHFLVNAPGPSIGNVPDAAGVEWREIFEFASREANDPTTKQRGYRLTLALAPMLLMR